MSDNLDKVISEMKKQDHPVARVFQEILEDARQMCSPGMDNPIAREKKIQQTKKEIQQRSETMETYSLPEALEKAKAGATMTMGNMTLKHNGRSWVVRGGPEVDHLMELVDLGEWQEEQPELNNGDWLQHKTTAQYILLEEQQRVESFAGDEEYMRATFRYLNSLDGFKCKKENILESCEKVTDERALMFLNAGRKPGEWKAGDIFQTSEGQPLRVAPKDSYPAPMENWGAKLICFVEDRKDRGDTP